MRRRLAGADRRRVHRRRLLPGHVAGVGLDVEDRRRVAPTLTVDHRDHPNSLRLKPLAHRLGEDLCHAQEHEDVRLEFTPGALSAVARTA